MMLVVLLIVMFVATAIILVMLLGRRNVREGRRVGREMVQEKEKRAPPDDAAKVDPTNPEDAASPLEAAKNSVLTPPTLDPGADVDNRRTPPI